MPFIKEDKNFKGRGIHDTPSYVGSITPVRDFRGFVDQSLLGGAAGLAGKIALGTKRAGPRGSTDGQDIAHPPRGAFRAQP